MQTIAGGLLMLQLTEEELGEIIELTEKMCTRNGWVNEIAPPAKKRMEIINRARTRPHPAPAFKRCCDSCINVPCKVLNRVPCLAQEKQENACEENGCTDIENCDEICQHSRIFSPLQMQESKIEAARKAREDVLNKLTVAVADMGFPMIDKTNEFDDGRACAYGYFMRQIDALRATTPQTEQEQPR
jgi:hypothetical protein